MDSKKAKFSIGNVVKHRHFNFRGVIYDVDFEFNNSGIMKLLMKRMFLNKI